MVLLLASKLAANDVRVVAASSKDCAVILSSILSPVANALAVVLSCARVTVNTSLDLAVTFTISKLLDASIRVALKYSCFQFLTHKFF